MEFGLPGGAKRAGATDDPDDGHRGIDVGPGQRAPLQPPPVDRPQSGQQCSRRQPAQLRLQTARAEHSFERASPAPRQRDMHTFKNAPAVDRRQEGRAIDPAREILLQHHVIQQCAAAQREQAHHHRHAQAMPDGKAVGRRIRAEHRPDCDFEDRSNGERRQDADHQAGEHEQLDRQAHPARRLMRRAREADRRGPEEHAVDEAQRVGDAEHAPGGGDEWQRLVEKPRWTLHGKRLGEEHFLGQEAVEQRHAGHRRGRDHCERRRYGHEAIEPVQAADVARSRFVFDDAGCHEERRLEGGVIHDVEDRRHQRERAVQPEQHRDQTEVADGRVGEQALKVMLKDRHVGAEHQGDQTGAADDPHPGIGTGQRRPKAGQQEHAQLHHRRRVQVGRYRRRCRHRVRQPEVERKLGALGERAEHDEDESRKIQVVRAYDVARREHRVQIVAAGDAAEDQRAGEEAQPARGGDDQRHARAVARRGIVMPVANEEKGKQAGQLPEKDQLDQVARQHHAEHRSHEGEEKGKEARHRVGGRHVVARVKDHEEADARDQPAEHPRETVHAQREIEAESGQPREVTARRLAGRHLGVEACSNDQAAERHRAGKPRFRITRIRRQQRCGQAAGEGKHDQDEN